MNYCSLMQATLDLRLKSRIGESAHTSCLTKFLKNRPL